MPLAAVAPADHPLLAAAVVRLQACADPASVLPGRDVTRAPASQLTAGSPSVTSPSVAAASLSWGTPAASFGSVPSERSSASGEGSPYPGPLPCSVM